MEFHERFDGAVKKVNSTLHSDSEIQQALRQYSGRSLVFRVRNDATYVFHISHDGIRYELNPPSIPDDMYLEIDLERARKLVYQRHLGLFDIPFVVYKNISLADVEFAKRIFGGG